MKKILIAGAALTLILTGCSLSELRKTDSVKLTPVQAKTLATTFINDNLMQPGTVATVDQPVLENGLYKVTVKLPGGRSVDAFMTIDGKQFFPQAIDMQKVAETASTTKSNTPTATTDGQAAASNTVKKSAKPVVEAFIMSYCPYGTQIEKGLIPAVKALGNKIDFKIRFVSYAMHGEKEVKENLLQYCIQSVQTAKYLDYLGCFLKDSTQSDACLTSTGIDKAKVDACVAASDKKFDITKNLNDKSTWQGQFPPFNTDKALNEKYGVQGSPTLVINGAQSESGRDSASLLKAMCDAMTKPGKECSVKLSSASPAAGFGSGTDTSGAAAGGCATPTN
jgi:hypothetical protein